MPFLAPFAPALLGGALGIGAAAIGANATKKATTAATRAQTAAAADSNALTREIDARNAATLSPFVGSGTAVLPRINALLETNPYKATTGDTFEESDHYNWLQKEARRGVNAEYSDAGGSGGRLKALQDRAAMVASNYRDNWFNQDQIRLANFNNAQGQYFNALTGQQDTGLRAAGATAGVSMDAARTIGNNNFTAASAIGNGALVNGQNTNALMSGITNLAGQFIGRNPLAQPNRGSYAPPPPPPATYGYLGQNNLMPVY